MRTSHVSLVDQSTTDDTDDLKGSYRGEGTQDTGIKSRMRIRVPAALRRTSSDTNQGENSTEDQTSRSDKQAKRSKLHISDRVRKRFTFVASGQGDNLTKLKGLSRKQQQELNRIGITRFAQIGKLSKQERHFIAEELPSVERKDIKRWHGIVRDKGHLSDKTLRSKAKKKSGSKSTSSKSSTLASSKSASRTTTGSQDNLRLIDGIGTVLEKKLNLLGVYRFRQIANWNKGDVEKFDSELDFKGRIDREEWIKQARHLSGEDGLRGQNDRSSSKRKTEKASKKTTSQKTRPTVSDLTLSSTSKSSKSAKFNKSSSSASNKQSRSTSYGFGDMEGLDDEAQRALRAYGVKDLREIANWSNADIDLFDRQSGLGKRVRRENWVERAVSHVRGGKRSSHSSSSSSCTASTRTRSDGERSTRDRDYDNRERDRNRNDRDRSPRRERDYTRGERSGSRYDRDRNDRDWNRSRDQRDRERTKRDRKRDDRDGKRRERDDLSRIRSINDLTLRMLNERGILRFEQIAKWSDDDIARFDRELSLNGQIKREDWVAQARSYSGFSSRKRSKKKETGSAGLDDLKRIRGIGKRIEELLHERGITTYQQIADFTPEVIKKLNNELRFRGRIEREQWLKQAKLLASGKDTEFSKRVDKGQVPSSSS